MAEGSMTRRAALIGAGAMMMAGAASAAPMQTGEGYIDVPGGKVYWRRFGKGKKAPLLTLHGGPGAAHNYLLPLAALATDRPVIFFDQLGCGKADAPTDESIYTVQRSVDELDAVRKALKLDRCVLFGHSWGSMLAIEYLCQGRGHGIDDVILGGALSSVPQAIAGQQRLIDAMPDGFAAKLHGLEKAGKMDTPEYAALTQQFYDKHVLRAKPSADALASFDALAKSIAYRVMNGPNEFYITGVIKTWDRSKDLKAITQRTLITTGQYDEVTLDCHQTIRNGVAGKAKLVVMKDCSHMTMCEKPKEYNAILKAFLAKTA
jgi:proline iminopeptidase